MTLGFARHSAKIALTGLATVMLLVAPAMAQENFPDTPGVTQFDSFDEALHEAVDMSAELEGDHIETIADMEEEHAQGGLPQFNSETFASQLFWLTITFALMYFAFSRRSLPAISGTIENRREHVQNDLETAERLREEAETVQAHYEEALQNARNESARLLNDAIHGTKEEGEAALARLREEGEKEVVALEERLQQSSATACAEMDKIAAEIARETAEKIFGISTDIAKAQNVVQSLSARKAA